MADNVFIAQPSEEIACYNGGVPKTLVQVQAPANARVKVLGWGISFDGTSITAQPANVYLARQTTAGTMTSLNPIKLKAYPETIQSSCQYSATVEPGTTDAIEAVQVHPQAGYEIRYPEGEEPIIQKSQFMAVIVDVDAAVNCRVKMICEE